MLKLMNEIAVFYDVDETLILHHTKGLASNELYVANSDEKLLILSDPYVPEVKHCVTAHKANVLMLKRHFAQGKATIVWSHGGVLWAETIVKVLGIEEFVTAIIPKLTTYCDDKEITKWGITNIYQQPTGYGR